MACTVGGKWRREKYGDGSDLDGHGGDVGLALEYGMFHQGLYSRYGILTSEGIQRQYLFSAKRRSTVRMDGRFCLLPPEELPSAKPRQQQQQDRQQSPSCQFHTK